MHKFCITLISSLVLFSCNQSQENVSLTSNTIIDTSNVVQTIPLDSLNNLKGNIDNSEPTYSELKNELITDYKKVEQIDTTFCDNQNNKYRVISKYYCLFDNSITIPGRYNWEDSSKTFTTHSFSNDVKILVNSDTVLTTTIDKKFFNDKLYQELKQYAILFSPSFSFNENTNEIEVNYSISIPITDIGIGCQIRIDKKGNCRKVD